MALRLNLILMDIKFLVQWKSPKRSFTVLLQLCLRNPLKSLFR